MKPIMFHPDARAELRAAIAYYEQQRLGLGRDLQQEVERATSRIQQHPQGFPQHHALGLRTYFLRRFPYTIFWNLQTRFGLLPWRSSGAGRGIGGAGLQSEGGPVCLTTALEPPPRS